jgi:hypothetical protein
MISKSSNNTRKIKSQTAKKTHHLKYVKGGWDKFRFISGNALTAVRKSFKLKNATGGKSTELGIGKK